MRSTKGYWSAFMLLLWRAVRGAKPGYLSWTAELKPSRPHFLPLSPVRAATSTSLPSPFVFWPRCPPIAMVRCKIMYYKMLTLEIQAARIVACLPPSATEFEE